MVQNSETLSVRRSSSVAFWVILTESFLIAYFALVVTSRNFHGFTSDLIRPVFISGTLIFIVYVNLILFFHSRFWKDFAGLGRWNIIPTIFVYITAVIFGAPILIVVNIFLIIGIFYKPVAYVTAYIFFATTAFVLGAELVVHGEIYGKGNKIVVVNHSSFIDTVMLSFLMRFRIWTLVSSIKMAFFPPFCFFLWWRAIFINRKNRTKGQTERIVSKMSEKVNSSYDLVLFPEATRFSDGKLHPFKNGAFKTAIDTQKSIIPVVAKSPWLYKSKDGPWWICFSTINVYVGKEVEVTSDHDIDTLKSDVFKAMNRMLTF